MSKKILVLLSGGIDSSACLLRAIRENGRENVKCLYVYYGSKHGRWEEAAARSITHYFGVLHQKTIDVKALFTELGVTSSLITKEEPIPEGHYEDRVMKSTVVPGRNLILASIASSFAEADYCDEVWVGCHKGDEEVYPDCRPEFIHSLSLAVGCSTDFKVKVRAPFIRARKSKVIEYGLKNGLPFERTRTCYKDQSIACGKCGSCQERLEAFQLNSAVDPLEYEDR